MKFRVQSSGSSATTLRATCRLGNGHDSDLLAAPGVASTLVCAYTQCNVLFFIYINETATLLAREYAQLEGNFAFCRFCRRT